MKKKIKFRRSISLDQMLISLRLGDGCFINKTDKGNSIVSFNATESKLDYIIFKRELSISKGIYCREVKDQKSGFKPENTIKAVYTRVDTRITKIHKMSLEEIIDKLDRTSLAIYYLDDGSLHKNDFFGHIYCNSFTEKQTLQLIDKIFELYPIKKCSIRWDKKKDGRKFPYVYLPKVVMYEFKKDIDFVLNFGGINSLRYKADLPSQTN